MAFNVKYIFEAVDKFSANGRRIGQAAENMTRKAEAMAKKFDAAGQSIAGVGRKMRNTVTLGLAALGGMSIGAAANIETLETAFESLLGGADKAKKMVQDLMDFTASTPFQLEQVTAAGRQLIAFGVAAEDVQQKLRFLGDIASGANTPLEDIVQIFGKIKTKTKASTEELMQLGERGVPIIAVLAKKLNKSEAAILDLASKGKLNFQIVEKALQSMAAEGGLFFNQMDKQSRTLSGLFSTLKDNLKLLLAEFGAALTGTTDLKANMRALTESIQRAVQWFRELSPQTKKIIVYAALFAAAIGPLLIGLGALITSLKMVAAVFVLFTSPVLLIIAAIAALAAGLYLLWNRSERFRNVVLALGQAIKSVFSGLYSIVAGWLQFWLNVINKIINGIKSVIDFGAKAINAAKGFFGLGGSNSLNLSESITATDVNKAWANIRMDINDPNRRVGNVNVLKSGQIDLNVGRNMAGAQ